jgi:TonB-dependent starch-binding outer membrane protein SusC
MKTMCKRLLFMLIMFPVCLLAQGKLTGIVTDSKLGQSLPGVNVTVQGKAGGTSTDFAGTYTLTNLKEGDVIIFSFLGFKNYSLIYAGQKTVDVVLSEESSKLEEVVVVGYGSVKKKDATGSVDLISSKDFNKGAIVSVDQLLTGKSAGVRITTNGGEPDSAPNIRIRGGSSISAQNSPLIVIDGVPLDLVNAAGNQNPLSLVNPNDIDSFSILKDASATAIYGSRASNGVIIITTKKGKLGKPEYNFSSNVAIGSVQKQIDVKDAAEFTSFVKDKFPQYVNLLGVDNTASPLAGDRILFDTKWVDLIYRESVTADNNFSVRASLFKKIPFRASVGYTKNQGLVRTNDFERITTSLKLTPMLLKDHLKIDINAKGSFSNKNAIDADAAFGSALGYDPTKPAFNPDGSFYQQFLGNNLEGGTNPLAILEQRRRPEKIRKFLGNAEFDYKMPFFPQLRAVVNLGLEASVSNIEEIFSGNAFQTYQPVTRQYNPGLNYKENQTITNKTMDAYLVYTKELSGLLKKFDLQGGYSYQNFVTDGNKNTFRYNITSGLREEILNDPTNRYYNPLNLQSFFGRSNIDLAGRYLFTFSLRADASSLFKKEKRWGYFPSVAFAWKISDEALFKDSKFISNLKLRIGAGKTGQQDVTNTRGGYFPSQPLFVAGSTTAQYLPGVNTYAALAFDPTITWEKTTTYNVGLDFDLFKNDVISGSVDLYNRKTTDLLAVVPIAPGQGLTNEFVKNVGDTESKGLETNMTVKVASTQNFNLELNGNLAFNYTEVADLGDITTTAATESTIPNGTGNRFARHTVGFQPYSAYVFEQIYTAEGKPVEGAFVDRNKDGAITDSDRYYKAVRPNWTFGFGLTANYKNLDFSTSFRGQQGGLVYNSKDLIAGNVSRAAPGVVTTLNNVLSGELLFNNNTGNSLSDYFLQDASFIRCENVVLGYKFAKAVKNGSLRVYIAANNLFLITKYTGQDPENFNGIDNNFYPRPRVYSFGLNLNF